jgi:hypothetical protein
MRETLGQKALTEEVIRYLARSAKAVQDELPTSRGTRQLAERKIRDLERVLPPKRERREQLAQVLENLKVSGARKKAASLAFEVVSLDSEIEGLEGALQAHAERIAVEEEFEAAVAQAAAIAEWAARSREGTAAPACTGRKREQVSPFKRDDQRWGDAGTFARAYAETGNPLYAWQALSVLCVHGFTREETSDALLPGWCVDYLSRTAEALLGLPPPVIDHQGGIAE